MPDENSREIKSFDTIYAVHQTVKRDGVAA